MADAVHAVRFARVSLALVFGVACTGRVAALSGEDASGGTGGGPTTGGQAGQPSQGGQTPSIEDLVVMPRRLQRIGNDEFVWSLVDLVNGSEALRQSLQKGMPLESVGEHGFAQPGPLGLVEVDRLLEKAKLAAATVGFETRVDGKPLIACSATVAAGQAEATCATATLAALATRAYRRPLLTDEKADLVQVFADARAATGSTFLTALHTGVTAVFTSPAFLYHDEDPDQRPPGVAVVTDTALAAKLAATFWRSTPDAALTALATQQKLHNPDVLASEVKRLSEDPRSERGLIAFFDELLGTANLASVTRTSADKAWTAERATALADDLAKLIHDTLVTGDGRLVTLINKGLLAAGAVMAAQSQSNEASPIKRGRLVRERILCDPMPAPPPNVPVLPEPGQTQVSERERFAEHSRNPSCNVCHERMDPIGFAFAGYDHLGRAVAGSVDTSGKLVDVDGTTSRFANKDDLFAKLAQSDQARRCFATQWVRFALGRQVTAADSAGMERLFTGFADGNIKDLFAEVTRSAAFRQEKLEEVSQ